MSMEQTHKMEILMFFPPKSHLQCILFKCPSLSRSQDSIPQGAQRNSGAGWVPSYQPASWHSRPSVPCWVSSSRASTYAPLSGPIRSKGADCSWVSAAINSRGAPLLRSPPPIMSMRHPLQRLLRLLENSSKQSAWIQDRVCQFLYQLKIRKKEDNFEKQELGNGA